MANASIANSNALYNFWHCPLFVFVFFFLFVSFWWMYGAVTKPVSNILTPSKSSVTAESAAVGTINLQQQQLLAKKRCAHVLGTDTDSIINIKKRNINHRLHRLKQIKENHADHVAEIYFLQTGGNMMDYPTWRKKAQIPELLTSMKQYRLELNSADAPGAGVTTTSLSTVTASPTIQTVGQQSHSQNTTQSQPPPLISTNSPHGKPSQIIPKSNQIQIKFKSNQCHSNEFYILFAPIQIQTFQFIHSFSLCILCQNSSPPLLLSYRLCLLPIANTFLFLFFYIYRLIDPNRMPNFLWKSGL